jgi:hypothetical protein
MSIAHSPFPNAVANLKTFFDSCPNTPIRFVYFTCDKMQCVPQIRTRFREWSAASKSVYSIFVSNGWCYTYGISSLKKLLYIDNTGVVSFEKHPPGAPVYTSKAILSHKPQKQVTAILGDHITVGISESKNPTDPTINTHKTYYVLMDTPTIQYRRQGIYCDCSLYAQPIDTSTICKYERYSMGEKYKDTPLAIPIIQKITNVYKGITTGGSRKSKPKTYVHKGVQYEIQQGPRNGKYIQVGNTRKYIGGSPRLTYKEVGFDDMGFVDFLYKFIFSEVAKQQPGMEDITVIYDEESYISPGSNKYICIIYAYTVKEEEEMASIYYIDALKAFTAYYTYITPEVSRTPYEKTCLQEFHEEIAQHIPGVVMV